MTLAKKDVDELAAIVDRTGKMEKIGDPLIDDFRELMTKRAGKAGFRGLVRILRSMDDNGDKKLSMAELSDGLKAYGLEYRQENLERLFRYLDRDKSGHVSVTEFIRGVRPGMPMARKDLVMQAYDLLDRNSDEVLTLNELMSLYDCSQHPEVLAGRKTQDEIMVEFASHWDKNGDRQITKEEFIDYYTDLSAGIDSDVYFELMMRNAWHISGGQGMAQNTTCLRVLCKFEDGRQAIVEVKNDLGLKRDDMAEIRRRLEKQGVKHIASIHLSHAS